MLICWPFTVGRVAVCSTIHPGSTICYILALLQDSCAEIQLCPVKPNDAKPRRT